jgi:hypothetical protein
MIWVVIWRSQHVLDDDQRGDPFGLLDHPIKAAILAVRR